MDEAARDQLIPYNPVRLCPESQTEEYKSAPLRLGQIQRYLSTVEQLGVLPIIYTGLSSGLRQCELITLSWADFHARYRNGSAVPAGDADVSEVGTIVLPTD